MFFSVFAVALLTEGVDRNTKHYFRQQMQKVALLTEGVDRNMPLVTVTPRSPAVALLTEGVDRNVLCSFGSVAFYRRPPHGGRG